MQRQQWSAPDLTNPHTVYQLSLRLGASYAATCHSLQQNKVFGVGMCDQLLAVKRREIKKRLAAPYEPADWRRDVWVITEGDDGILLEGSKADLVVVKLHEHSGSGYLWRLDDLEKAGLAVVKDSRAADPDEDLIGGVVFRTVISEAINGARYFDPFPLEPGPEGTVVRPGLTSSASIASLTLAASHTQIRAASWKRTLLQASDRYGFPNSMHSR